MNNKEKVITALVSFCNNIEKWFTGEGEQDMLYQEIVSGFSPDFKMITGDGDAVSFYMFSEWLPTVYGKFPSRRVILEDIEVQYSGKHGLATYTEIQTTEEETTRRASSAIFLLTEEKALWFHLIESWI
ncbi:hypothetical protein [Elizabethkingia meningoseptica]|uniref:hypothetical protein n=1 Tax=Elizabethkingia meningoseptica TaxID=238 RepID=UPI00084165FE|nr:hypothetical protein [Elizabethkingia meningoseptica]MDE5528241.1 hypothetical protein [Elizabethkingia meningoseptica]ODM55303.1 hypothetical protein BES09_02315 [Elizabethkingia meningoseptica]OHT30508.1 hypothetical protein BFF93_02320 [Elizabethkingia meningoseptica]OPC15540.1 hypothetical protein BAX93_00425 [Elizabethkingia meningoseptica]